MESAKQKKKTEVVIIGGSLAGLLCGISLKHLGHSVTVIEQESDERQSHMAGVCLGIDAENFLERYDCHQAAFAHTCTRINAVTQDETIQTFLNARREITSWDTFYFRLRSMFDGYASSHYPGSPQPAEAEDRVAYKSNNRVLCISRVAHSDGKMVLTILNNKTQEVSTKEADLVIGADGPNSSIRTKYLPNVHRKYAGYIAWRGVVPESEVSPSICQIFEGSVTVHMMRRHHCIMYIVPGLNGSLQPGQRFLNFLWYTNELPAALDEIMVDGVDGHRHHYIVPAGRVRKDIWAAHLDQAKSLRLAAPFLEVMLKIRRPFVQVITDFCSPRATFENGRVLLVGDALCLCRPHTAFSATQAAFPALMIEDYVNGKMTLSKLENELMRYSNLHWRQSVWWGEFYQRNLAIALLHGLWFWVYCGIDVIRSWWRAKNDC